jgi:hypothetical protein
MKARGGSLFAGLISPNAGHREGLNRCVLALVWCVTVMLAHAEQETPLTRLFDTSTPLAAPLNDDVLARRTGWQLVPEDRTDHRFTGDTVLLNDKLAVVFSRQGPGPEVFSRTPGGLKQRASVGYATDRTSALDVFATLGIIENTSAGVILEATLKERGLAALRFRLTAGEAILEIRPTGEAGFVSVQSNTRYLVVPDYFGDDMVYTTESPLRDLCLPAENLCLSLLAGGDAILMSVCQSGQQDVWLVAANSGKDDDLCATRIRCLKDKAIWLSLLESPGIWHAAPGLASDNWKEPFPAKWRASFVRGNGVADSWDLGTGPNPEQSAGKHQGPLVAYPIDRSTATPLTATCPTDVMRNTLGVGPCQYILACEGLASQGDPTPNSVMGWVEKQFEQNKQKKAADDIRERLEQMTKHVADARSRIERYSQLGAQLTNLLAGKAGSDQFRAPLDDLERCAAVGFTSESSPELSRQLASQVGALIGADNALAACQRLGQQLRRIGAVQDRTLAKCRMAIRRLQAQSRTVAARQPSEAGLAKEIQRLTGQMLQNK